jgi:hypothetical protein
MPNDALPSDAEIFFFETNGYLVLERFLSEERTGQLRGAVLEAMARRKKLQEEGGAHTGITSIERGVSRIFYILDDDDLFLEMLDWPPLMPYVHRLLNERPHHHASDAIVERGPIERGMGWHLDGHDDGYRLFGAPIPLLQLKVGYYLTDMTEPGNGNLCVIPGSHKSASKPSPEDLRKTDLFLGAVQVRAPAGSMVLFHNALWHSSGPMTRPDGERIMLYYAYEHPWMMASQEHWGYSREFYNNLPPERRRFFHGFVFDPPEMRWG